MIAVDDARKIVRLNCQPLSPVKMLLREAAGFVLAEDVYASADIPAYPQSSMDGYAFAYDDWKENGSLKIEGEMAAGATTPVTMKKSTAIRVFTGAAVPPGTDTVIMQEKTTVQDGRLLIVDEEMAKGNSVRPQGAEIAAGDLALQRGDRLTPGAIGFLAGIGVAEVSIHPFPSVAIIVTGNELQQPGQPLHYGQVYESNSVMLTSALAVFGIHEVVVRTVPDSPELLKKTLATALEQHDLVLLTGGASVGDYDFVVRTAVACGVEQLFHRVKQRPGKPLYMGKKNKTAIFGLPGNPSSVLTCFYQYVYPALEQMTLRKAAMKNEKFFLTRSFHKPPGLTHFLKGFYEDGKVTVLGAQESYRLSSFARANCLIRIGEEVTSCEEGEMVDVQRLPQ